MTDNGTTVPEKREKRRDHLFRAGYPSANPKGRPKAQREVAEIARKASPELMRKLIEMAKTHPDAQVRMAATGMVFDRAFGKAKAQVEIGGEVKHSFVLRAPALMNAAEWEATFGAKLIEATADQAELNGSVNDDPGSPTPDEG